MSLWRKLKERLELQKNDEVVNKIVTILSERFDNIEAKTTGNIGKSKENFGDAF